jgi:hypothetical protein
MGGSVWLMWHILYKGLKTGKFNYGDSLTVCDRQEKPLRYWYLVSLFSAFLLLICSVVVGAILEMWAG